MSGCEVAGTDTPHSNTLSRPTSPPEAISNTTQTQHLKPRSRPIPNTKPLLHPPTPTPPHAYLYAELVKVLVLRECDFSCTPNVSKVGGKAAVDDTNNTLQLRQPVRLRGEGQ